MLKNKFLSNLSWTLAAKVIQMIVQLLVGMMVARYLGPTGYGTINYVAAYITFAASIVQLGLSGVIVKEFCDHPESENVIVGTAIKMRLIVGAISAISVIAVIVTCNPGDKTIFYIAILESISLLFAGFDSINYWYQYRQQLRYSASIQLCACITVALYKVILVVIKADVYLFAFSSSLDVIVLAALYYGTFKHQSKLKLVFQFKTAKGLVAKAYPFLVAGIMIIVYQQVDKIMLGKMLDTTQVGYYSAVTTICNMWSVVPAALLDVMRPIVMQAKGNDEELYKKRLTETFALLIYLTVCFSVCVTIFASLIIRILYGEAYLVATQTLRIAVWYCTFSYIGSGRSIYLICEGKNKYAQIFCLWGALIDVVLNWFLIPKLGINGAALATLITHVMSDFAIPGMYKETRAYCKYVVKGLLGWHLLMDEMKNYKAAKQGRE
jgi:O-antigen/teichoic acid export membrane protein